MKDRRCEMTFDGVRLRNETARHRPAGGMTGPKPMSRDSRTGRRTAKLAEIRRSFLTEQFRTPWRAARFQNVMPSRGPVAFSGNLARCMRLSANDDKKFMKFGGGSLTKWHPRRAPHGCALRDGRVANPAFRSRNGRAGRHVRISAPPRRVPPPAQKPVRCEAKNQPLTLAISAPMASISGSVFAAGSESRLNTTRSTPRSS